MESLKNLLNTTKDDVNQIKQKMNEKFNNFELEAKRLVREYQESLKDGTYEDNENEEEGSGEKRKIQMQERIERILDRAEKIKEKINKGELEEKMKDLNIPFKHEDGRIEQIEVNFEQKLQEFIDFYKENNIDTGKDFEEMINEIWDDNFDQIKEEIEKHGFNEILLIPPTPNLNDLKDKTSMKDGYYLFNNFEQENGFAGAKSNNVDKVRLILVHKAQNLKDHEELNKTLGTKGLGVPLDKTLTLEDYLIFAKKYFEETGKHLNGWI